MSLTLRAVSLNDLPLTQPITARFDALGGTIGRSDGNTMALPDPERHISRQQAEIASAASGYLIRNIGSANPIMVRNLALAQGESAPLKHSDQVRIGGYLLEVIDDDAGAAPDETVARRRAAGAAMPAPRARSGHSTFGDLGAALSPNNPFADLLGTPPASAITGTLAGTGASRAAAARLPVDFDPFAQPAKQAAETPAARTGAGAFDGLIPAAAGGSIDEMFGLQPAAGQNDPLAGFMADVATPRPADAAVGTTAAMSVDPLVLFGSPEEQRPKVLPTEIFADQVHELRAAFKPARPVAEAPAMPVSPTPPPPAPRPAAPPPPLPEAAAAAPAARAQAAASARADAAALWAAFCAGAGVAIDTPQGDGIEQMRLAGTLLREAVEGMLQLMAVRSATRNELHAQVTIIRPRGNNPLKFSPDAPAALEQLLQPPMRGFLPGPAAMTDAMNDLVGHAIGTMAGTRAALEGVLGRFAPQQLDAKLTHRSMLDNVLPMARKARLWDLYLGHYEAIRDEAQEDFHTLFGKAFLAAYEQQLERLRRNQSAS